MKKKTTYIFMTILILVLFIFLVIMWENKTIQVSHYEVACQDLPNGFSGFRIAHISDLHNAQFGADNKDMLQLLKMEKPDFIAITGDLVDSRKTDIAIAIEFVAEAVKIAPCYYVPGNHEARIPNFEDLKHSMKQLGVTILEDESVVFEREEQSITVMGITDPGFWSKDQLADRSSTVCQKLEEISTDTDGFRLLLSHRPEHFRDYKYSEINLVLSGHAHGGQIRLPFIGGIFAPNQGFFPEYDAGQYSDGKTQMIVSRGLGSSLFPFRINNRPEIVMITLQTESVTKIQEHKK